MRVIGAALLSVALFFSFPVQGEKMNLETTDLVISKLERALPLVKDQAVKYTSLLLRLGDLYSERGRLNAINEYEQKCTTCVQAKNDRLEALRYYRKAFPKAQAQHKGTALFQMAHLYRLVGQPTKAGALFFKITNGQGGPYPSSLVASAHVGAGEVHYSKGHFKKSLKHFNKALAYKNLKRRGFVLYRKAWSQLNIGQIEMAKRTLVSILKSSELMSVKEGEKLKIDRSFQNDISRDLAVFMARGHVTSKELNQLISLSSDNNRRKNIFFLGTELARLGQKKSALRVLDYFLTSEKPTVREKLQISVHVAQLNYDLGQKSLASSYLDQALQQWKKQGCTEKTECEALRIQMKNFISHWNKNEKSKPSLALLKAYESYVKHFPNDQKMVYWAAITAQKLKRHETATQYFRASSKISKGELKQSSILGEIESAELSKKAGLKLSAYNYYLANNKKGKKQQEVQYQRAYVYYEQKNFKKSATEFKAIALDRLASRALRIKSADLAIDSLTLLNDDKRIETWSIELAKKLPERKLEYLRTSRQASLKMAQKALSSKKSTPKVLNSHITQLRRLPFFGAQSNEVKIIFGTRLALAEKSKNLAEIVSATKALLGQKGLGRSQIEDYRSRQAWAEEMRLNFKEAYRLTKKLRMPRLSPADRHLKLTMLAELSGFNAKPHLQAFIKATPSRRRANQARAQLIRESRVPWKVLKKQANVLKYTPDILASLTLDTFSRYENQKSLLKILSIGRIRNTQEGTLLSRQLFINDYLPLVHRAKRHEIQSRSPYLIKKGLQQRMNLIGELEQSTKVAVQRKDWVLQLITLNDLKNEYDRVTEEVLALPYPKSLTKKQHKEYEKAIKQQVKPFEQRTAQLNKKIKEFWKNKKALNLLNNRYRNANIYHRRLLKREMNLLRKIAPTFKKWSIARSLKSEGPEPSGSELRAAWKELKESPFSVKRVTELMSLEERHGSETKVAYLNLRLAQLKSYIGAK